MTRLQSRVLLATILGSAMVFADGSIVTVAIPTMREAFGASLAQMQWVSNAYTLALASLLLLGGAAGDRYGLRIVFAAGVAVFALASIGCSLAGSVSMLIAMRALQGVGGAMLTPGSLALLGAHFPEAERGRAIGAWAAATSVGAACGPLLGGWLIDHASWPSIFWINVPVAALALVVTIGGVEDLPRTSSAKMDWIGGWLAVVALGALTTGLTALGQSGGSRPLALAACAFGAVALVGFFAFEARASHPMLPPHLLLDRRGGGVNALTFLLYFALSGAIFFLPSALIVTQGWSAARAGSIFLGFTIVLAGVSRWGGGMADRLGVRFPLTVGPLLAGAALALLGPAAQSGDYWRAVIPCMALLGLGMGVAVAPLSTAVMNAAPQGQTGVASAVNNAVARVAGLLAVASLGGVASFGFTRELRAASLAPDLQATLLAGGFGATPGAGADAAARAAFVAATSAGFTTLTWLCAGFAALAGIVGYLSLGPARRAQLPR